MQNYRFYTGISLILLCLLPLFSKAQQTDSLTSRLDSLQVFYFFPQHIDSSLNRNAIWLDTAFHNIQNYDPLLRSMNFSQNTGNIGQSHKNMAFSPTLSSGFDLGIHAFDGYLLTNEKIRYYSSLSPFTEIKYIMGSRKEQYFHVIHSHTIKRQLVIAGNFRIVNSPGRRSFRQKADDINTYFTVNFTTKNNRYGAYGHYYYNRMKCMENGGIVVDSIYEEFRSGRNLTQFSYGLNNALTTLKENAWFLKQTVNLDFRKADSSSGLNKGFSIGRLSLETFYQKPRFYYSDQDANSGYYPINFSDSSFTSDSIYYKKLENTLNWTNNETDRQGRPTKFRFFAGFRHSYIEIHQEPSNSYLSQYTTSTGFSLSLIKRLLISASAHYVIGDYNGGDLKADAYVGFRFGDQKYSGTLSLSGTYAKMQLPWMAKHYYSNYFRWDFNFDQQQTINASITYNYPQLKTGISWYNLNKPLYWDTYAHPRQFTGNPINIYYLFASKDLAWGKFEVDSKVILQYSDNTNIIHLPLLVASQSYFVTFNMFKKALQMQTGIEAWYNTPYYADAWMPATHQFYLQNDKKIGNYVYIDVFLNLKIKRAFIFLALDHANSGLFGYKYYLTPHYPTADRSFKFGVSWLFHD